MARRRRTVAGPGSSSEVERQESFRVLRSNLMVALSELDNPTVIITSALPDEGKTAMCANLAGSLASAGVRVVAADLDLRHPNLHSWLGGHNEIGLSDVLLRRAELNDALQFIPTESADRGLYLLPTGTPVNDPTELLGTNRTVQVLEALASQADVVLLDTPPVLPVADTLVISRAAAGAVLVVASRSTSTPQVRQAKDALTRNRTRLLGVILNKVQERDRSGSGYGYGYGYDERGA
jgi:capsular exopolysaccharide synthesis family protein